MSNLSEQPCATSNLLEGWGLQRTAGLMSFNTTHAIRWDVSSDQNMVHSAGSDSISHRHSRLLCACTTQKRLLQLIRTGSKGSSASQPGSGAMTASQLGAQKKGLL